MQLIHYLHLLATLVPMLRAHVCKVSDDTDYGGLTVNCSHLSLTEIPTDLPQETTVLDLSFNNLTVIKNMTFGYLRNLKFLGLNTNYIHAIEPHAFRNLSKLLSLFLYENLMNESSFSHDTFHGLNRLQTLNLERNQLTSYPDLAFVHLTSLRSLFIQSIEEPVFREGFSKMTNLKYLQMDDDTHNMTPNHYTCAISKLTNATFEGLNNTGLRTLVINKCPNLTQCDIGAFSPLQHLTHLELAVNQLGIHRSFEILQPFSGRNMTRIFINNTYNEYIQNTTDVDDHVLTKDTTQYLVTICLKRFSISHNKISLITIDALSGGILHHCLEIFDLSHNTLLGDINIFLNRSIFSSFKKLRYFDFSFQLSSKEAQASKFNVVTKIKYSFNISLTMPKTLEYLDITQSFYLVQGYSCRIHFTNAGNLKFFKFGYNVLFDRIYLSGLESLNKVDYSGHSFAVANNKIFKRYPNLTHLWMQNCGLQVVKDDLFQYLEKITHMDVSHNHMNRLPYFPHPELVENLQLSNNNFLDIPITLDVFPNLNILNMSFNNIGTLDQDSRNKLDEHATRGLKIDLRGNIFSCGCKNLDFILWLMESLSVYRSNKDFICLYDNGTLTNTANIVKNVKLITNNCNGARILIITITCLTLLLLSIYSSYVIGKNPTRHRNLILRLLGVRCTFLGPTDFDFSVYVGYSEKDVPFVFGKLRTAIENNNNGRQTRLFLKDRDVLPGEAIADAIIDGINKSWKTILVVSADFLEDEWSPFTVSSAVYSMTDLIPNRILVLLVGEVQIQDLPESLLNAVEEEVILHVGEHNLWTRLEALI